LPAVPFNLFPALPLSPLPSPIHSSPSPLLYTPSSLSLLPLPLISFPSSASPAPLSQRLKRSNGEGGSNHAGDPDNQRSNRPERRTALVVRELVQYKVDITALSQTCFSEQGKLETVGAGYTFFWSDHPQAEQRDAGFAFAIRNDIVGRLHCLPQGINEGLIRLCLGETSPPLSSVPTLTSSGEAKDEFREYLHAS
uniref:Uncharacterized protein n=1 Tax=Schistocephalus solidus TaxID=70667 RepID=A0A183SB65_SCHSO